MLKVFQQLKLLFQPPKFLTFANQKIALWKSLINWKK